MNAGIANGGDAYQAAPDVESMVVAGELCLLEPGQSQFFILNETAEAVWRLATSGAGLDEMVSQLAEQTGSPPAVVRAGVSAILDQLEERHLLVRSG